MDDWRECTLGDLVTLKRGYDLPQQNRREGAYPILSSSGVSGFHNEYMVPSDGVVTGRYGTIGEVFYCNGPHWPLNTTLYVDNFHGNDKKFVYYFMKTLDWKGFSIASAVPGINRNHVHTIPVRIPPLATQRAIATTLSVIDDRIDNNKSINHHLEQIAQAIFKSWFVDFEPFADSGFVESELGEIPVGWRVTRIGDLPVTVTDYVANGSFASLKENVTLLETPSYAVFVRNVDLKAGSFGKYVDEHSYRFLSKSALFGGEVIISNVGDVGSVFLCPYLPQPMTLGNNMIMLTAKERKAHNYFFYLLFKHSYGAELIRSITGGSAQPKFNKTDFRSLCVVMPTSDVMDKFLDTVECLFQRQADLEQETAHITELRDLLLPRLMSGELSVANLGDTK